MEGDEPSAQSRPGVLDPELPEGAAAPGTAQAVLEDVCSQSPRKHGKYEVYTLYALTR